MNTRIADGSEPSRRVFRIRMSRRFAWCATCLVGAVVAWVAQWSQVMTHMMLIDLGDMAGGVSCAM